MDHYCRTECETSGKYAPCTISITRAGNYGGRLASCLCYMRLQFNKVTVTNHVDYVPRHVFLLTKMPFLTFVRMMTTLRAKLWQ